MIMPDLIDEASLTEHLLSDAQLFTYYDLLMRTIQNKKRGMLIDMSGNIIWQEDYDAWQLRIKNL